jgi:hypothetical protein
VSNTASELKDVKGEGCSCTCRRGGEMIRQALSDKLPPEYAAMIQQYFANIAKGKPAPAPEKR